MKIFRIDDIGASTKQFEQYGKSQFFTKNGKRWLYFPWANYYFLKRIWPFKMWGPYHELTAKEWGQILDLFTQHNVVPLVAVTACWVEKDSTLTPFPKKFPEEAAVLKQALSEKKIIVANHGLTHCIAGKHLPLPRENNRKYHREFWPEFDQHIHTEHIIRSQDILETFFEQAVTILVPPGNMWSIKTYRALKGTNINTIRCAVNMRDSNEPMEGVTFIHDSEDCFAFHDRELKLYGLPWLKKQITHHNT